MAQNLRELQKNPQQFKDEAKADNEAVKKGQKMLKSYHQQEEEKEEGREKFSKTQNFWQNFVKNQPSSGGAVMVK